MRSGFKKYFLPSMAGLAMLILGVFVMLSFYTTIPSMDRIFTFGWSLSGLLFVYAMVKYHLFSSSEKIIFDKSFYYKTLSILAVLSLYLLAIPLSGLKYSWNALILTDSIIFLVIFTHSFYEWFSTFINDIIYNPSSGLSVVNDKEIYNALRNYNRPPGLEDSTLLRLKLIKNKITENKSDTPVDALRTITRESIEYFKPKDNLNLRTKQNLKYHLLKMLAFDEAEEGQILWELGFEDYPLSIMTREGKSRPPKFKEFSPAEYSYISRNAFLALKKEAIHDITWRISYLEKLTKRK